MPSHFGWHRLDLRGNAHAVRALDAGTRHPRQWRLLQRNDHQRVLVRVVRYVPRRLVFCSWLYGLHHVQRRDLLERELVDMHILQRRLRLARGRQRVHPLFRWHNKWQRREWWLGDI